MLSLKELIIRRMSVDMAISERIISSVISHQFNEALNATNTNKSVEISGFGKFLSNSNMALKLRDRLSFGINSLNTLLENDEISSKKRIATISKLEVMKKDLEILKKRIRED